MCIRDSAFPGAEGGKGLRRGDRTAGHRGRADEREVKWIRECGVFRRQGGGGAAGAIREKPGAVSYTHLLVAPDVIQELFSGKHLVGGGREEIEELQLLRRHLDGVAVVDHRVVGEIHDEIRVLHVLALLVACRRRSGGGGLVAAQDVYKRQLQR